MTPTIRSARSLWYLSLALLVGINDGGRRPNALVAAGQQATSAPEQSGRTPLPTQVWATGPAGKFTVFESGRGHLTEIDAPGGQIVGRSPASVEAISGHIALPAPNGKWSAVVDSRLPVVRFVEGNILQPDRKLEGTVRLPGPVAVAPNPQALAVTADSTTVLVACDSTGPAARHVCLIDVATGTVAHRPIRGSSNLRGIAVDPQGRFALAVHLVHKSHLPSTQIEQGWVFTNSVTYLSLAGPEIAVTLPLDLRTQGYANPEGVAISADGSKVYIAHAGADLVSVVDLPVLLKVVDETVRKNRESPAERAPLTGPPPDSSGYQADDLRLARRFVRARIPVGSNPRGIGVSADGRFVAVANRLDDSVSIIDAAADVVSETISLIPQSEPPLRGEAALLRDGERLFHSGRLSFSGQFSCASCHPDGSADGLNWDLPADGFNNFFNTKSLLGAAGTAPYGWLGTSNTLRDRFSGTLRHLFQHEPTEHEAAAIEAYLSELQPPRAAARPNPAAEPAIVRGKMLFEGKAGCRECHRGAKFTDGRRHDIGTGSGGAALLDTPALTGVSTTPPYLHDGRAATLEDIFAKHNQSGLHGQAADLAPAELADLVEYLKSL